MQNMFFSDFPHHKTLTPTIVTLTSNWILDRKIVTLEGKMLMSHQTSIANGLFYRFEFWRKWFWAKDKTWRSIMTKECTVIWFSFLLIRNTRKELETDFSGMVKLYIHSSRNLYEFQFCVEEIVIKVCTFFSRKFSTGIWILEAYSCFLTNCKKF